MHLYSKNLRTFAVQNDKGPTKPSINAQVAEW